jgi:hypothetical protein
MRLQLAVVCCWIFAVLGGCPSKALGVPNVIVILADDLGLGDYSAFGTRDVRTPHLDRLAREGMTFENFRANSCVCSATRAALLTGRYPDRVGVPGVIREEKPANSWGYLDPRATLLPQLLKKKPGTTVQSSENGTSGFPLRTLRRSRQRGCRVSVASRMSQNNGGGRKSAEIDTRYSRLSPAF